MTIRKTEIVGALTGAPLLLPDRISSALTANGRIKFALSWLQAAEAGAGATGLDSLAGLGPERALAGLSDDPRYAPPSTIVRRDDGIEIPQASAIVARLLEDLSQMRSAAEAGAEAGMLDPVLCRQFKAREEKIRPSIHLDGDVLPAGFVSMLSRPPREGKDTLHGLVMDLHKAINAIAAALTEEDVAGARVYRLEADDKASVSAFMHGLNRTAPLKFDHPGLATTAMRDRGRLIIQNDLGTTDAHVLIAEIQGLRLSVTHSDIHRRRLDFFQRHLNAFSWTVSNRSAANLEEDIFYLAIGVFEADTVEALESALERLGASLVFLIDWNKARKSLGRLVSKSASIAILDWAADHECGHRGYLEIGGDGLMADLLETVSKATGGFYISLRAALGDEGAVDFLKQTLRIASEELRKGRSPMAIRDVLRAELLARVASIFDRILAVALDHAALILDIGNLVRAALLDRQAAQNELVRRAKTWEALADREVTHIRELCGNGKERAWRAIASGADDAADDFEETVFRLQFLPREIPLEIHEVLLRLAEHAVMAIKDYVRLLCAMRSLQQGSGRGEIRIFLDLIEKLHDQEHATDEAEREVFACLMGADVDAKTLNVATAVADGLEDAADALLRAGRLISDHAMGEWFAA